MKIDFHTHFFPKSIAFRVIRQLETRINTVACGTGDLEGLLEGMKRNGIDRSVFLQIATTEKQQNSVNDFAHTAGLDHPQRIIPFGSVYPKSDTAVSELQRLKSLGFKGIKLHPEYQEFQVNDETVFPVYEYCQSNDLIIVFHAGIDPAYMTRCNATPEALAQVAKLFPKLKIVCAHMGGMGLWPEVVQHLCGLENIWFDTACVGRLITDEEFMNIYRNHDSGKILFATDYPWSDGKIESDFIDKLSLTSTELEKIYFKNAIELLKI